METARCKIGQTAQSKAIKDLAAADYQLQLHEDAVLKEHAATKQADEDELASLQKAVDDRKADMEKRQVSNQEALDQITAIRTQITMSRKTLPASTAAEETPQAATEPTSVTSLPQPLTDVMRMMQSLLDSVKAIPNMPTEAQQQMQTLQTTIDTNIKPMMSVATPPPVSSQFGPAAPSKTSSAASAHPYAEADKSKKTMWGDCQGDDA